jgi:hypothetical protein
MRMMVGRSAPVRSIREAVAKYSKKEFQSPTRSTIPMLALLRDDLDLFNAIVRRLNFPQEYELSLEYTVAARGRRGGGPSHTDVMLIAGDRSLAIEAKWTEPMYPSVDGWFKSVENTTNRKAVLEGWLRLIEDRTSQPSHAEEFGPVIYQMLHRAASAAKAGNPSLAYFLFKSTSAFRSAPIDPVHQKLKELWTKLGRPATFGFHVVEIEMVPTPEYEPFLRLPKGKASTAEAVRSALQDSYRLFSFPRFDCQRVE